MDLIHQLLGLGVESKDLSVVQICLRGAVVFLGSLFIVRFADRRFLSKMAALDVILGFVLASMLARAINGSAPLFGTLIGAFALVLLHRILARISYWSEGFGKLVKGNAAVLISNGVPDQEAMRKHAISEKDLHEELRQVARLESPKQVKQALLERSGNVSVIRVKGEK